MWYVFERNITLCFLTSVQENGQNAPITWIRICESILKSHQNERWTRWRKNSSRFKNDRFKNETLLCGSLWNIVAPVAVLEAVLRPSSARHASASIQRLLAFSVLTSVTAELRLRGPKIKKISEFLILFVHPPNLHSLKRLFGVILKNFHRKKIVSTNLLLVFIALELDLVRFLGKIYRCKRRRNFTFSNWSLHSVSEDKKLWFFPLLDCFFDLSFFQCSGFLALQGRFLNFSRFSPWFLKFSQKKFLQKIFFFIAPFEHIK